MTKKARSTKSTLKSKTSKPQSLRVLMVEDSEDDVLLIIRELKKGGYDPVYEKVETEEAMSKALREKPWDVILCDYKLPKFNATSAIAVFKETNIDIPLLIVSGAIGEETAVECMRLGAHDYIMKNNLSRLVPAIERELKEAESRIQRKQAEEALRRSEEKYRNIIENIQEGYFELDLAGNFTFVNDAECRNMGYSREELIGMNNRQYTNEENAKKALQAFSNLYKTGESCKIFDYEVTKKDGTKIVSEQLVSLIKDSKGKPIGFRGLSRHITERKRAEESLRVSEEKYRLVVENAKEAIIISQDVKLVFVNRAAVDMIGYSGEILASKPFTDFIHPDDRNMVVDHHIRRLKGEEVPLVYSFRVISQDGTVKWVEFNTAVIQWQARPATLSFLNDITKRKQAEEALRRSEEKYRNILENIQEGYFELDLAGNFTFVNEAECRNIGYPKEELIGMNNRKYQDETTAQEMYQLFRRLYRTGEPVKALDVEIIRKNGTKGFNEVSISLIRDNEGKPIGFRGISRDITERKQAEEESRQSIERMRKALGATVQAISMIVEMKDPYTSGHQQRVADLARSIATEMGLSAERRDFIRTASTIHDIGKIAIPSEILSKPTKLTDLEFNLIKTHVRSGYDILKDIEFSWPVADVVLQHHERMDGSGYPQGLKGDDILLEARILAVADVVEAIASHRPYRPALGIDLALEEISGNKGILYDADVVDACLKLFREKGYTMGLKNR